MCSRIFKDEKGRNIGSANIFKFDDGRIWLGNFCIYPEYQNKGYGQKYLSQMIEEEKINSLVVFQINARAIHIYEKFGFKIKKSYHAEDLDVDVHYMERD